MTAIILVTAVIILWYIDRSLAPKEVTVTDEETKDNISYLRNMGILSYRQHEHYTGDYRWRIEWALNTDDAGIISDGDYQEVFEFDNFNYCIALMRQKVERHINRIDNRKTLNQKYDL